MKFLLDSKDILLKITPLPFHVRKKERVTQRFRKTVNYDRIRIFGLTIPLSTQETPLRANFDTVAFCLLSFTREN